jgi:mono/diheme cytochrome c family protein
MNLLRIFLFALAGIIFAAANVFSAGTDVVAATPPVFVPDYSHANEPLPDGVLVWDSLSKATNAAATDAQAHFVFNFTNVSGGNVVILNVHPSCGCTTTELPPLPWILTPGTNGQIGATVNIAGKSGTLFKKVTVSSDRGQKDLNLQITILPPFIPALSDAERARQMAVAKIDRQAVFKNNCATCHVKNGEGKYGEALYQADCAICHEAAHRATMVPDLHNLKTATNPDFWQTWIAHGKPGSFMPAFSTADGGPLTDIQIASLTAYLNQAIPSHVAPQPQ